MTTTAQLLDTTVYGSASGNYDGSSTDFYSDAQKGVGYYLGQGSIQTVTIQVLNFQGVIRLWGTLDLDPDSASWVSLAVYNDPSTIISADYHPIAITGNYTWVRAEVTDFAQGQITTVFISY